MHVIIIDDIENEQNNMGGEQMFLLITPHKPLKIHTIICINKIDGVNHLKINKLFKQIYEQQKSHVFTPCYLDENLISLFNLNVSFFELKVKNAKECYITCF